MTYIKTQKVLLNGILAETLPACTKRDKYRGKKKRQRCETFEILQAGNGLRVLVSANMYCHLRGRTTIAFWEMITVFYFLRSIRGEVILPEHFIPRVSLISIVSDLNLLEYVTLN